MYTASKFVQTLPTKFYLTLEIARNFNISLQKDQYIPTSTT